MKFPSVLFVLFSLLVIPVSVNSADKSPKPPRPSDWKQFDRESPRGDLYYDKNSIEIEGSAGGRIVDSGALLIVYNKPEEVEMANGTKKMAVSKITIVMMDCKSGLTIPLVEYWFDVPFPKKNDKAIAGFDFTKTPLDNKDLMMFPEHTQMHEALCPMYI